MSSQFDPNFEHRQPLPAFVANPKEPIKAEDEPSGDEFLTAWLWPVMSWFLMGSHIWIGVIALRSMWDSYNWFTHFTYMASSSLALAAIAAIYRYILRGGNGVRSNN